MRSALPTTSAARGALLLGVLIAAVLLLPAGRASADSNGYFCPPDGTSTISIAPGTAGTCVHGIHHALSQVLVYRLNNTIVVHCAGANSTTSPSSSHVISYVCGIGTSPNGFLATVYDNTPPQCGYPAHKNDGSQTWSGFYGAFNYTNECL
jgi:hypothetical protein